MTLNKKHNAFTLMEVMIAVVIIGILATLAGPRIMDLYKKVKVNTTKATMAAIKTGLMDYQADVGRLPSQREGLDALVDQPRGKGSERWQGPYLSGKTDIPLDEWNREFEYNVPPQIKNKAYKYFEIISYGPNGEGDETDNINMGE